MKTDMERFMSKVAIGRTSDGCWKWIGAALPRGYGRFYFDGKPRYAHRVSLTLFREVLPRDDQVVMHRCDNPACVNPNHLTVGTQTDNMRDASAKGRVVRVQDWHGVRNPKAKLSPEDFAGIVQGAKAGESSKDMAERFGVTQVRINQIIRASKREGGGWQVEDFSGASL